MIAVTMPGKMGDALYALPLARLLYGINGEKVDFYTSDYCRPMKELVEYQPYINEFIIPENYKVERMDMGCQPWFMPVREGYSQVHHAGFKSVPDRALHQFIASQAGYNMPLGISYECPSLPILDWNGAPAVDIPNKLGHETKIHLPYICIASRSPSSYDQLFYDLTCELRKKDICVVQIGGSGEYVGVGRDVTGISMLDTLSILSRANGFVGLMSSQLVLANGFSYPKIAPHDGKSWDMGHVVRTASNFYPINPTVDEVLILLGVS